MQYLFSKMKILFLPIILLGMTPAFSEDLLKAKPVGTAPEELPALVREEGIIVVPESSPLRESLQIAPVETQPVERQIVVPGVVEADPGKLIKIVPPVLGRIIKLYKCLGDQVKGGEPLFTLDSAELAQYYSDTIKAQSAFELAKRHLQRQQELTEAGIAPRKDLEQAENDFRQAQSEVDCAKGRLSQLGVSFGQGDGRKYTFPSPISGRVIEVAGAPGGFWNDMNAPILTVADLSTVWLAASVQEQDIAAIAVGQTAKIALTAYPGEIAEGQVKYVGEVLDPDTRTVKVRIAIDNASGHNRPGMFAKVTFSCSAHSAVVIPTTALVQSGFHTRVFVEASPWHFEPRVVEIGTQIADNVEVVSGLKPDDRIVIKNGVLLND